MAWVRFDDGFFRHPKVVAAGRDARDVYTSSIFYANQNLTDGHIPEGALRIIAADAGVNSHTKAAKALVREGMWIEVEGGYQIHDYLDYQVSAASVTQKQTANKRRQQEWRDRNRNAENNTQHNTQRNAVTNTPVTRTDKDKDKLTTTSSEVVVGAQAPATPDSEPSKAKPRAKRAAQIPPDWQVSDRLRDWAHGAGYTDADVDQESPKFRDYWISKGEPRKDWDAGFRMWMANAKQYGHLLAKPPNAPSQIQSYSRDPDEAQAQMLADLEELRQAAQRRTA